MQQQRRLTAGDRTHFGDHLIPSRRAAWAFERGVERNICIHLWGGIGDQICAEPFMAWIFKNWKGCKISLATIIPDIFKHLPFEQVFDLNWHQPIWEKYLVLKTISPPEGPESLPWHFMCHGIMNGVDFCSAHAMRWELPVNDKPIHLTGSEPSIEKIYHASSYAVAIHPGKHWQSKTFPKAWWDKLIDLLVAEGLTPILIGADADDNRGTVDVKTEGCVDMRNKLSIAETVWLLQRTKLLITNDSAPFHMAASGNAWIAFLASCKHPDFISHWRHPIASETDGYGNPGPKWANAEWNWREKNFMKGNAYYLNPNLNTIEGGVQFGHIDEKLMAEWLPDPAEIVEWGRDKWK